MQVTSPERKKKAPVCEMLESSWFLSFSMLPILSWKLKIIAYRGRPTIPTSSKLELFCQYVMIPWHYVITNSSIVDDTGVWDPPLFCLFLRKALPKWLRFNEVNIYMFKVKKKSQSVKSVQSWQLRYQRDANSFVLVALLLTWNMFYTFF